MSTGHNNFQVTWLRRADYHILTVGMVTYTTDERFSAVRGESPHSHAFITALSSDRGSANGVADLNSRMMPPAEDWMLQIRSLQKADAGIYECQVNTQHPMLSAHVLLSVLCEYIMDQSVKYKQLPTSRLYAYE